MKNKLVNGLVLTAVFAPAVAMAQFGTINRYITALGNMVERLVPLVMGIALLLFFWGLAKFILKAGDEKEVANGRRLMIWGLVALFVMTTVWGLTNFIRQQLEVNNVQSPILPTVPKPR